MSGEEQDVKSNNIKIAVTAVMSVLLGAAFIMALILFGMRVQTNIRRQGMKKEWTFGRDCYESAPLLNFKILGLVSRFRLSRRGNGGGILLKVGVVVVLVTHEAARLSDFKVNTVTRDADYNLQIDAVAKYDDSNLDTIDGRAVFVKISNIQPKDIEVKIEKEE